MSTVETYGRLYGKTLQLENDRLRKERDELLEALVRLCNAPYPSSPADCLTEAGYKADRVEYDAAIVQARATIARIEGKPVPA